MEEKEDLSTEKEADSTRNMVSAYNHSYAEGEEGAGRTHLISEMLTG